MAYTYPKKNIRLARLLELFAYCIYKLFHLYKTRNSDQDEVNKILIIEPFQMGDLIALSVLIDPLKKDFPGIPIIVLTKKKNENVFEFDKSIKTVTCEFPWSDYEKKLNLKKYIGLFFDLKKLKRLKISIGIDPRGDVRSQIILLLIGCKQRIGYTNYVNSNMNIRGLLLTAKAMRPVSEHRYDWNLNLLTCLGIQVEPFIKFPTINFNDPIKNKSNEKYIVIHPGGGWVYKQWPINNWIKLIKKLSEFDSAKITVIGGEKEKDTINKINSSINNKNIKFLITSYKELITCIQSSDLFVCLDSGPMNLAVCLDIPAVALFGPGDSEVWKPYSSKSSFIHKKEKFPCNPCLQKVCYYPEKNCMAVISVDEVKNHIIKFINIRYKKE